MQEAMPSYGALHSKIPEHLLNMTSKKQLSRVAVTRVGTGKKHNTLCVFFSLQMQNT